MALVNLGATTPVLPNPLTRATWPAETDAAGDHAEHKGALNNASESPIGLVLVVLIPEAREGRDAEASVHVVPAIWDRTRLDGRRGAAIWCGHGSSLTTWSRSGPWPANPPQPKHPQSQPNRRSGPQPQDEDIFRSK